MRCPHSSGSKSAVARSASNGAPGSADTDWAIAYSRPIPAVTNGSTNSTHGREAVGVHIRVSLGPLRAISRAMASVRSTSRAQSGLAIAAYLVRRSIDQRLELRFGESVDEKPAHEELRSIEWSLRAPTIRAARTDARRATLVRSVDERRACRVAARSASVRADGHQLVERVCVIWMVSEERGVPVRRAS
jgi:hypothetical protein